MTGYSAFNRLFDETMVGLRFKIGGKSLAFEQTLNLMVDADPKKRKTAAEALAKTFKENCGCSRWSPTRSPRTRRFPTAGAASATSRSRAISPTGSGRGGGRIGVVGARGYPRLSHRYYAMKARWFGKKQLPHWDRNAPLPQVAMRTIDWPQAQQMVLTAYGAFSPKMGRSPSASQEPLDRCAGTARKSPGAFFPSDGAVGAPYVMLNYQGKPRDVMTLAHELGHGVHQVLAAPNAR